MCIRDRTYIAAAEELVNGTDAQSGENGYYTYIYNPPAGYALSLIHIYGRRVVKELGKLTP